MGRPGFREAALPGALLLYLALRFMFSFVEGPGAGGEQSGVHRPRLRLWRGGWIWEWGEASAPEARGGLEKNAV